MNHLKYPQKFLLISLVFSLPMVLMVFLLMSEFRTRIDFSQQELYGDRYLRPLQKLWQTTILGKIASEIKDRNFNPAQIPTSLQSLIVTDQELRESLQTSNKLSQLKLTVQTLSLKDNLQNAFNYSQILDRIEILRDHVGDTSNLILDPDLDSYYLMDSSLLKLPYMQNLLAEVQIIGTRVANPKQINPELKSRLIQINALLKAQSEKLNRNLNTSFQNNPTARLKPQLEDSLSQFRQNLKSLTSELDRLTLLDQPLSSSIPNLAKTSFDRSTMLWDQVVDELDLILQHRINGYANHRNALLIFIAMVLLIVIYLFTAFYLSVMQTVAELEQAAQQMAIGHFNGGFAVATKDELGMVVNSFNRIARALQQDISERKLAEANLAKANLEISSLNNQLKAENLRMGAELEITRKLQRMILPKIEELDNVFGIQVSGYMEPASEVGGDYYDVLQYNGRTKIAIGDVTGHGLESGLLMVMVQTAVRTLIESDETDAVRFMDILNRTVYGNVQRMDSDKNLSLSLIDYCGGKLFLSGQHEELILVRAGGMIERIDTIDLGFPIGLEEDISGFVDRIQVELNSGDVVILYTDGIPEAENAAGKFYSVERLCQIVSLNRQLSATDIKLAAIADLRTHIGNHKVYDDITLIVLKQN